ncbi:MAG: hypothetical protein LBL82_00250 [Oscillospiraceae bacterium]|nr:hypothetical protein [Oscillospiraceae bacterium]
MKYIFVIEAKVSKRTGVLRWHTHMIMSGMDRNDTEKLWGHGDYVNADRLQAGEHGFAAIAVYLAKKPEGAKRWCESRNLHKPNISPPRDGKISKKYLAKLATERADDSAYWESRYKGYRFLESEIRYNDYNGYWYVDIVMYKRS